MQGWHVEAHGWCTSEGKSPLDKGERLGFVHGPQRGLETHREVETHTWGRDCWVYNCEWSFTLNNEEKNGRLI